MFDPKTMQAARRLLKTADPGPGHEAEVAISARLATCLQAVITAQIVDGTENEASNGLLSGLASTIGWCVAKQPPRLREDGLRLLFDLAQIATDKHADLEQGSLNA